MPNICFNKLTVISYDDAEHSRFWQDAKGSRCELSFESLLPKPADWDEGKGNWRQIWGTKWDVSELFSFKQRNPYITECTFRTAWAPPEELFMNIYKRYPNTIFVIEAEEWNTELDAIIWASAIDDEFVIATEERECAIYRERLKKRLAEFFEHPDAE